MKKGEKEQQPPPQENAIPSQQLPAYDLVRATIYFVPFGVSLNNAMPLRGATPQKRPWEYYVKGSLPIIGQPVILVEGDEAIFQWDQSNQDWQLIKGGYFLATGRVVSGERQAIDLPYYEVEILYPQKLRGQYFFASYKGCAAPLPLGCIVNLAYTGDKWYIVEAHCCETTSTTTTTTTSTTTTTPEPPGCDNCVCGWRAVGRMDPETGKPYLGWMMYSTCGGRNCGGCEWCAPPNRLPTYDGEISYEPCGTGPEPTTTPPPDAPCTNCWCYWITHGGTWILSTGCTSSAGYQCNECDGCQPPNRPPGYEGFGLYTPCYIGEPPPTTTTTTTTGEPGNCEGCNCIWQSTPDYNWAWKLMFWCAGGSGCEHCTRCDPPSYPPVYQYETAETPCYNESGTTTTTTTSEPSSTTAEPDVCTGCYCSWYATGVYWFMTEGCHGGYECGFCYECPPPNYTPRYSGERATTQCYKFDPWSTTTTSEP